MNQPRTIDVLLDQYSDGHRAPTNGQFIGHAIEGGKPSFCGDLRFLLIGPLFVLGFLYRRLHVAY